MAVEIELKLRITPEQFARLKRHALLKAHSVTRPVTRCLQNIYYDTPKLELHKSEMALRLRHTGRQWLQTLKGGGSVKAGLHQRNEWEVPVSGAELDFSFSEMTVHEVAEWEKHLPLALRKKLQPIFVTDFSRSSRMLNFKGAQIELSMDQGEVRTEQLSTPICELELELKSGEPQQLFEFALAILEIVPFELEAVSKAEQGYRLLSGYVAHPVKGSVPALSKTDTMADVLRTLSWSCLQHFQNNLCVAMECGVADSDDAEYLHQMRVALRRLRVVLRMAEKFRADEQLSALSKDISALCIALGRIREWDVFIAQTARPICARMAGHSGLQDLLAASERRRAASYAALRGAVQARELQRLMLRFALWMNGDYWQQFDVQLQAEAGHQAQDFATRRLHKLAKRFARSGEHLEAVDAARLHALRIVAKKLRYSAEFFATLYGKQNTRPFLAALSQLQDVLGQINDIASAHRLLDELAADDALDAHQEAVVLAKGWIAHDLSHRFSGLRKTIQKFNKQPVFWEDN